MKWSLVLWPAFAFVLAVCDHGSRNSMLRLACMLVIVICGCGKKELSRTHAEALIRANLERLPETTTVPIGVSWGADRFSQGAYFLHSSSREDLTGGACGGANAGQQLHALLGLGLISSRYVGKGDTFMKNGGLPCQYYFSVEVTPKAKSVAEAVTSNGPWKELAVISVQGIEKVEVTGISIEGDTLRKVEFLAVRRLTEVGEALGVDKTINGTQQFQRYDDGWRIVEKTTR